MNEQTKRLAESVPEQKERYRSPRLTEYGSVRELTTGATGASEDLGTSYTPDFMLPGDDSFQGG